MLYKIVRLCISKIGTKQPYSYQILYFFSKKKEFFLLFFFFCSVLQARELVAPLRIEGLGNILVGGYQWLLPDKQELLLAGAIAEQDQQLLGFNAKKTINQFEISNSLFYASRLKIPATYTRGTAAAPLFFTDSTIGGFAFGGNYKTAFSQKNEWKFSVNLLSSQQNFFEILDKNHETIPALTRIELSSFSSNLQQFSIDYKYRQLGLNNYQERGWQFFSKIRSSIQETNTIYSGTLVTDLDLSGYIPLGKIYFVPRVFYSSAQVVSPKEDNLERLGAIFNIQCDNNSPESFETCRELKRNIVDNLARHNRLGTSSALGGVSQLRSETILRYKGSQTEYQALEARYLFAIKKVVMEPVLFWEQGRSFDEENSKQEKEFITSRGLEYRFHLNEELVYKFIYASSDRNTAWQLSVASVW